MSCETEQIFVDMVKRVAEALREAKLACNLLNEKAGVETAASLIARAFYRAQPSLFNYVDFVDTVNNKAAKPALGLTVDLAE